MKHFNRQWNTYNFFELDISEFYMFEILYVFHCRLKDIIPILNCHIFLMEGQCGRYLILIVIIK